MTLKINVSPRAAKIIPRAVGIFFFCWLFFDYVDIPGKVFPEMKGKQHSAEQVKPQEYERKYAKFNRADE